MSAVLHVKWNGKKFPIEFPSVNELKKTTVRDLKATCQQITGVESKRIELNAFGANMSNDDLQLEQYDLRPGCSITLKSPRHKHHDSEKTQELHSSDDQPLQGSPNTAKEQTMLDQLQTIRTKLDSDILPTLQKYERDVKTFLKLHTKTSKEKKKQAYMSAFLNEQLMQVLFDLDSFVCGNNVKAREVRKDTVKHAQALLDKLDELKSVVKSASIVDEEG